MHGLNYPHPRKGDAQCSHRLLPPTANTAFSSTHCLVRLHDFQRWLLHICSYVCFTLYRQDPAPFITLRLADTPETRLMWPHKFELLYKVGKCALAVVRDASCPLNSYTVWADVRHTLHVYFCMAQLPLSLAQ